ncbi:hypothetical protein GOODEAATRI_025974, partial [Goodea atripinnis]
LLAVCDLQSDQTIQQFRYVGLMKNWNDAQTYCRERFSDLATIQNYANSTKARQAAGTSKFWIGLFNGTWKWSEDTTSSLFTRWSSYEPRGGNCVTVNKYGSWSTNDCEELHQFLCYHGTWYPRPCSENYTFLCSTGGFSFSISAGCDPAKLMLAGVSGSPCRSHTFSDEVGEDSGEGRICRPE